MHYENFICTKKIFYSLLSIILFNLQLWIIWGIHACISLYVHFTAWCNITIFVFGFLLLVWCWNTTISDIIACCVAVPDMCHWRPIEWTCGSCSFCSYELICDGCGFWTQTTLWHKLTALWAPTPQGLYILQHSNYPGFGFFQVCQRPMGFMSAAVSGFEQHYDCALGSYTTRLVHSLNIPIICCLIVSNFTNTNRFCDSWIFCTQTTLDIKFTVLWAPTPHS